MTQTDAEDYARAVKEYEHRKKHLFLFPHDGLGPISYIRLTELTLPTVLIMLAGVLGISALMSFLLMLTEIPFTTLFIGWICFFAIGFALTAVYGYFMHINYIKNGADEARYGAYASAIAMFLIWFNLRSNHPTLVIVLIIGIFVGSIAVMKWGFWDKYNPKPEVKDFDTEVENSQNAQ